MMRRSHNIFIEIDIIGHDEDFRPKPCQFPTGHPPGSKEKVDVLCYRVLMGEELWHAEDTQKNHLQCHSEATINLIARTAEVRRQTQIQASQAMFDKARKRLKKRAEKTLSKWKKRRNHRKDR
jgi:hypothetical protein